MSDEWSGGFLRDTATGALVVVDSDPLTFTVEDFGAVGDGVTDDTAAIQAALNAVPTLPANDWLASGAEIRFRARTYKIAGTISFPKLQARVRLVGAGKRATTLMRSTNAIMLDISGDADSNVGTIKNVEIAHMRLDSEQRNVGVWTAPLVRCYYAQFVHWTSVDFYRAGGRAIAGVRYYDARFENCRWDYCGAASHPAAHFKCSEAGRFRGEFGYSDDSCNNLYFVNCTWEQCPGTDLHLDGSQSDGTFSASRRINMCRLSGCKMENQVPTERSDDARLRLENVSHLTIDNGLIVSAQGTASGNPTDWLVLKLGYNVKCGHYTAVGTEAAASGMRTGLRLEDTTGVSFLKGAVGSVQTVQKPTVALVEFVGNNTLCDPTIAKSFYDNNPGGAALFSGSARSWVSDPHEGRTVIRAWSAQAFSMVNPRTLAGGIEYAIRFRVAVPTLIRGLKFIVTRAATADDRVDTAIRSGDLRTLFASHGGSTGKLNVLGVQEADFPANFQADPGVDYYATILCDTPGGTAADLYGVGQSGSLTTLHQVQGTAAPNVEWTNITSSYPIPRTLGATNSGVTNTAALWLVRA